MRLALAAIGARADPTVLHAETGRWQRMPARRGREFLAGRALARRLAGAAGRPWAGLDTASVRSKPRPIGGGYDLSIAHDLRFVAVASVASGRVGIDIADASRSLPRGIERRLCTPAERAALPDGAAGQERLRELLTVKEAYAKALGVGLALRFDCIDADAIERMPGVRLLRRRTAELQLCAVHLEATP